MKMVSEGKRESSRFWGGVRRAQYLTRAGFLNRFSQLRDLDGILESNGFKRFKGDFLAEKLKETLYAVRDSIFEYRVSSQSFFGRFQSRSYFSEKETRIEIEPGDSYPFISPVGLKIKVQEGMLRYPPQEYNVMVEQEFEKACNLIWEYVCSQKRGGWVFESFD